MSSLILTTHHASCWKYFFKPSFNGEKLEISLGCHEVYPWRVSTTSFVGWEGLMGAKMVLTLVRDRLRLTREGTLQCKVCLHPHLEQRGIPPVEKSHSCGCCFFLSYRWELAVLVLKKLEIWPSNTTSGHTHWGKQIWKRHVHPNVHCSTVYNSQDMEAT